MVTDSSIAGTVQPELRYLRQYSDIFKLYEDMGGESKPLLRILELAHREGARYCLLWRDQNNSEWKSEYSAVYSKLSPAQPDYVLRLDFFSKNPFSKYAGGTYVGYVSLRPGPIRTVIECMIPPPSHTKTHYLLCKGTWSTQYPGKQGDMISNTVVDACPFVQQDGVIGICAHASLRMLSMLLECNYSECSQMTTGAIREKVSAMPLLEGSHFPSTGLTHFQIVNAIEEMGASATLYWFEEGRERTQRLSLEQLVYPYMESGIPVVVGISTEAEGHAILLIGHTFDRDSWWQQAEMGYYPSLAEGIYWIPSYAWAPEFIIQDDNFGPYLSTSRTLLGAATLYIVVPIPHGCPIFLPGFRAESLVAAYLAAPKVNALILSLSKTRKPWRSILEKIQKINNVVLRPLLVKKEVFLEHVGKVGLSNELVTIYQTASLPEWIWLIEISVPELHSRYKKIGEALLNPTYPLQHIRTGREPLLTLRIFDVTTIGNRFTDNRVTKDTKPVAVLSRPSF